MSRPLRNALAVVLPLTAVAVLAPWVYGNHLLLFNFIVFVTLSQGVNILYGFTGYLPFGYVGFFGAGAYGFAAAVMLWHVPPELALGIGGLVSVAFGLVLTPTLRLSGAYFAIANLAAALAIEQIVSNPALTAITKGPYGVSLPDVFAPRLAYGVAIGIMVFATVVVSYLRYSRFGLALQAVRDDAISASAAGIDIGRARTIAWLLSALIGGLMGADFAWYVTVFFPDNVFGTNFTIFALVFTLFGGAGTLSGPIFGVLLLYGLYNYIGVSTPQYFQLIFGLLIVALVLFLPNGLASLLRRWGVSLA